MINIRTAITEDLELICLQRRQMFLESGKSADLVDEMNVNFSDWLSIRLSNGTYKGFIAENECGKPIAGIGVMELDWPPHPAHPCDDKRGYVLNLYVEPSYRLQGIAQKLMRICEGFLQERGIKYVILHATDAGRPLYEQSGWTKTSEMAKLLH
jgi:ribosomal protein S18 acetylase RimI-like enzyme